MNEVRGRQIKWVIDEECQEKKNNSRGYIKIHNCHL